VKTQGTNKPVNKFVLPSELTFKCRKSKCLKHRGYYLGKASQVRDCFPDVDAKWCLDARVELPLQFVKVNGKYSPNPEDKISGECWIVCPLCAGQTLAQMKSKGDAGCHCMRHYGDDLEEHECSLVEAIVPAHLHNLVVGPEKCIRSNQAGALDLNKFILFAQLAEHFGYPDAIEMIDSPNPRAAAQARGKIVKSVELVAYRPALCTSK